jgi:exopolysaccharide production protein ExoZ
VPTLSSVQVLRGVAALTVTIAHTNAEVGWWTEYLKIPNPMPTLGTGAAGVDLFFVISGFIMVYTSSAYFGSVAGAREFFSRRLIRIVPLYWIGTALAIFHIWYIGHSLQLYGIQNSNVISSLLFLSEARSNGEFAPVLPVGWTLNYEMFFYFVFALALLLPRRAALASVVVVLFLLGTFSVPSGAPYAIKYISNALLHEFIIGVIVGWLYVENVKVPRIVATAALCVGVAAFVAYATFDPIHLVPQAYRWGIPAGLIVFGMVFRGEPTNLNLGRRIMVWIGDMSYSLYLFHGLIMGALRVQFTEALTPLARNPWFYSAFIVGVSLALSYLIFLFVERPLTRWLHVRLVDRDRSTSKTWSTGIAP